MMPEISIVMSVRNGERTLRAAMESIVGQTFTSWELIAVDDGSTDGTIDILRGYGAADSRIRIISDGVGRGLPDRLNQSVALATGRYIARMDADDVAYPDRLERQAAFMDANPHVDLVGAAVLVFGVGGQPLGRTRPPVSHDQIARWPEGGFPMAHPTYFGRQEWFRRFSYDRDANRAEDQMLLLRCYQESTFANLPDILLGYRMEEIALAKIFASRVTVSRGIVRRLRARPLSATLALAKQVGLMSADAIASWTGLGHRLLRHRALPITAHERQVWNVIWSKVSVETAARTTVIT
jgi:glycosyltransferase involved in cell wall biosynthesis